MTPTYESFINHLMQRKCSCHAPIKRYCAEGTRLLALHIVSMPKLEQRRAQMRGASDELKAEVTRLFSIR